MAATGFISTIILFGIFFVSINAQCSDEDLRAKFRECSDTGSKLINSNECTGFGPQVMSVFNCFSGCEDEDVPPDVQNELSILKEAIDKAINSRCTFPNNKRPNNSPAEARDGDAPAAACGLQEALGCVSGVQGLINIPTNVRLGNLEGICNIIKGLTDFIDNCGGVIVDCIDTFASLGVNLDKVRYGINVANELSKGGCDCAGNIETAVKAYTNLPKDRSSAQLACPVIQTTTTLVKGVLDNCVNKIVIAVGVTNLDWLTITLNAINIANPIIGGICGTFTILSGSGAATISLGLLTATSVVIAHILRSDWI